ncbi:hypothetical protein QFC22_001813 [Naganishia vaughanmartiniae]|uniref:Uncharacterized protein n=1 Tax=Naganishia vaughanmartiniae TaxID=1424756 RepID=A0ACC2XFH5_9TREE|nr:hypothetical protein QFC22_001813 [Naganishia vaughanmartiniae]
MARLKAMQNLGESKAEESVECLAGVDIVTNETETMSTSNLQHSSPMARLHNSKPRPAFGSTLTLPSAELERQSSSEDRQEVDECSESEYESMLESGVEFGQWHEQRASLSTPTWIPSRPPRRQASIMSIGSASMDSRSGISPAHRRSTQRSLADSAQYSRPSLHRESVAKISAIRTVGATGGTRRPRAMSGRSTASSKTDYEEEERMRRFQLMNFDLDRRFSEIVQVNQELEIDSDLDVEMTMASAPAERLAVISLWSPETANDDETEDGSDVQSLSPLPTPSLTHHTGLAIYSNFPLDSVALQRPPSVETPMADIRDPSTAHTNSAYPTPGSPLQALAVQAASKTAPSAPLQPSANQRGRQDGLFGRARNLRPCRPPMSRRAVSSPVFAFQALPAIKQADCSGWEGSRARTLQGSATTQLTTGSVLCRSSPTTSVQHQDLEESRLRKSRGQAMATIPDPTQGRSRTASPAPTVAEFGFLASEITTFADQGREISVHASGTVETSDIPYFAMVPHSGRQQQTSQRGGGKPQDALWPLPPFRTLRMPEITSTLPLSQRQEERSALLVRPVTRRRPVSMEDLVQTVQSPQLRTAGLGITYDGGQGHPLSSLQTGAIPPVPPVRRNPLKRATTAPVFVSGFPNSKDDGRSLAVFYHTSPKSSCIPIPTPGQRTFLVETLPSPSKRPRADGVPSKDVDHGQRCKGCAEKRATRALEEYRGNHPREALDLPGGQRQPSPQDPIRSPIPFQHILVLPASTGAPALNEHQSAPAVRRPRFLHRDTTLADNLIARTGGPLSHRPPSMALPMLPVNARTSPLILPPNAVRFNISLDLAERQEHRRRQANLAQADDADLSVIPLEQRKPGRMEESVSPHTNVRTRSDRPTSLFSHSYTMHAPFDESFSPSIETNQSHEHQCRPVFVRHAYSSPPGLAIRYTAPRSRPVHSRDTNTDEEVNRPMFHSRYHTDHPSGHSSSGRAGPSNRHDRDFEPERIPTPAAPKMSWNRIFSGTFSN